MAYTKTVWVEGGPPGISADRMNNIEQGIADAVAKSGDTMTGGLNVQGTLQHAGSTVWDAGNLPNPAKTDAANTFSQNQIVNAQIESQKNNPAINNSSYNQANIWIRTTDGSAPIIGFERGGYFARALYLSSADGNFHTIDNSSVDRTLWDTGQLRWNTDHLEYNNGGTWTPVGGVKNVQRGSTSITTGTGTINVTISSVNMSKASVNLLTDFENGAGNGWLSAHLTSATNMAIEFSNSTSLLVAYWEVIESN